MENIIMALITSCVPASVTLILELNNKKLNKQHAAKQSILQMILEDRVRVSSGGLPENYQAILHEFDIYTKNGGNSYVHRKVDEYIEWYEGFKKIITEKDES